MSTDSGKTRSHFEKPVKRGVRRRLSIFGLAVCGTGIAVAIVLTALSDNLEYFRSPTDVQANIHALKTKDEPTSNLTGRFRLGGMVSEGSYKRKAGTLEHHFKVTDFSHEVDVVYQGALPDLFREGQGVVAVGRLKNISANTYSDTGTNIGTNTGGQIVFVAGEVLAKHDENYMPPEVAAALNRASDTTSQSESKSGELQK